MDGESRVLWALCCVLLSLHFCTTDVVLEKVEWDHSTQLACGEDLTDCSVNDGEEPMHASDPIQVERLQLKALLCCQGGRECRVCLEIYTSFAMPGPYSTTDGNNCDSIAGKDKGRGSSDTDHVFSYVVTYTVGNGLSMSKVLEFTLPSALLENHDKPQVWLSLLVSDQLGFGSEVFVFAQSVNDSFVFPSVQTVCSTDLREVVEDCDAPRLHTVIDQRRGVAILKLDHKNDSPLSVQTCLKYDLGDCVFTKLEQNGNISIPLHAVVPCLCIQAWWMKLDALHVQTCPFSDNIEFFNNLWNNVSVSVNVAKTNRDDTVLSWSLGAPCRVDAELWLCKMNLEGISQSCDKMPGSRIHLQKDEEAQWSVGPKGHSRTGQFGNVAAQPTVCVLAKVHEKELGPWCPFAATRRRWSPSVILTLLLVCLAILIVCLLTRSFKGARRGGHVVLLCPPDLDETLAGLVNGLGSVLSTSGFSVNGDLWRRAELCALGPLPWLHKQLEWLQCGGKAVLVVTRVAWERAEEWQASVENRDPRSGPYSDVFAAVLGCIQADQQEGRAGKRFVLARFERLTSLPVDSGQPLPGLFQGLSLYSLPTQASNFMTELRAADKRSCTWAARLQAGLLECVSTLCSFKNLGACALNRLSMDRFGSGSQWESELLRTHHCP